MTSGLSVDPNARVGFDIPKRLLEKSPVAQGGLSAEILLAPFQSPPDIALS
jgi:hypothetical protein